MFASKKKITRGFGTLVAAGSIVLAATTGPALAQDVVAQATVAAESAAVEGPTSTADAQTLINLVNDHRSSLGLAPLVEDAGFSSAAVAFGFELAAGLSPEADGCARPQAGPEKPNQGSATYYHDASSAVGESAPAGATGWAQNLGFFCGPDATVHAQAIFNQWLVTAPQLAIIEQPTLTHIGSASVAFGSNSLVVQRFAEVPAAATVTEEAGVAEAVVVEEVAVAEEAVVTEEAVVAEAVVVEEVVVAEEAVVVAEEAVSTGVETVTAETTVTVEEAAAVDTAAVDTAVATPAAAASADAVVVEVPAEAVTLSQTAGVLVGTVTGGTADNDVMVKLPNGSSMSTRVALGATFSIQLPEDTPHGEAMVLVNGVETESFTLGAAAVDAEVATDATAAVTTDAVTADATTTVEATTVIVTATDAAATAGAVVTEDVIDYGFGDGVPVVGAVTVTTAPAAGTSLAVTGSTTDVAFATSMLALMIGATLLALTQQENLRRSRLCPAWLEDLVPRWSEVQHQA